MKSSALTIAYSEGLKNGKAFLFLVALLCSMSLLGHAACCGSYWMDVVESCETVVEEGASSSMQPRAIGADHHVNSTGFAYFGRFAISSICSVINHIVGHNAGSLYIYKPFCVISRLGPVEVFAIWIAVFSEHVEFANKEVNAMADDLVIGNWKTKVIHSLEFVCFTVQLGTHRSLWITVKNWSRQQIIMQLILNSKEGTDGECRFSTVNDTYLERLSFLRFDDLEKSKPLAVWSGWKKTSLVVCITTLLATCVVLPHLIENGRISAASVPKFGDGECTFEDNLPSSDTNGVSSEPEPLKTELGLSKSSSEEPERDSHASNDSLIPEKLDSVVEKEKSSRKRRKRRSSGSSSAQRGKSAQSSSSPLLPTATGPKAKAVNRNEKKPVETRMVDENNPLFLFPCANDQILLVPAASSMPLHARAPGPKLRNREMIMNATAPVNGNDDKYTYDMWADHLSEIAISEISTSFFVMGPLLPESVSSPHKDKDD